MSEQFKPGYRPGLVSSDVIDRPFYVEREGEIYHVKRLLKNGTVKSFNTYKTYNGAVNRCGHRNRGLKGY